MSIVSIHREAKMEVRVVTEEVSEQSILSSAKVLAKLQSKVDQDASCSLWDEQYDVNHSRDNPDKGDLRPKSTSVSNDHESSTFVDEFEKGCETSTFCLNASPSDEDVPPEFEKVFVKEYVSASDEEPDEQITMNEHPRGAEEPQPGCSSWLDEVKHQRGTDCPEEENLQFDRNEEKQSVKQTKKIESKTYNCTSCDYKGSCYSQLNRHFRIHTGEKPFLCLVCTNRFSQKSHLFSHMRKHTGEKPFHCTICSRRFSEKVDLNTHMRTHTGEKPYQCSTCSERFSHKCTLIRHMRIHTGEKPFLCTVCTKSFSNQSNLSGHMRTHTGEKPFECPICTGRFSHRMARDNHIRTHTGEKPFQCTFCTESFSRKFNLRSHMRIHTGEKPFQCEFCSEKFSLKTILNSHIRRNHKGEKTF